MDLEEQVKAYKEIARQIDELEQQKKLLSAAIMKQVEGKIAHVGAYTIRRYSRLSIKLSLEDAKLLDCVKMQETIDKDRIKSLFKQGHALPGVSELEYIQISSLRSSSQEELPHIKPD